MSNTQANELANFTVYRDGQISRWETYQPQLKHNLRSFGQRLWINSKEFGNSFDEMCTRNSISNVF